MTDTPGTLSIALSSEGGRGTVLLSGELDVYTSGDLRDRLAQAIDEGAKHLVIDLADLDFIDSTGLGVLVGALKRARQAGGDIELRSPNPATRKVFEITGLMRVFTISE